MELFLSRDLPVQLNKLSIRYWNCFIKRPPVQLNKLSIRYWNYFILRYSLLELFLSRAYQFNWISCLFVIGIVFIKRLPVQLNKLSIRYWNCFYREPTSSIELSIEFNCCLLLLELFLSRAYQFNWISCLFVIGIVFIERPTSSIE